ncbi:hypothetical protein BC332_33544 [Capsicum chinense]|nr:hypothetical protein BC332_33544 [Capsicum chinense]
MAARKGCTPSQLALAWIRHQGDDVALPYKSDIPRAIWNPPLTRRGSPQPKCAARVGVSESDMPHITRPAYKIYTRGITTMKIEKCNEKMNVEDMKDLESYVFGHDVVNGERQVYMLSHRINLETLPLSTSKEE